MLRVTFVALFGFALTGCSATWKCEVKGGSGGTSYGCGIQGTFYQQAMNFLRPTVNMLAESVGFTYEEWSASDFSDFSVGVESSNVSIKNSSVTVRVYQGISQLGSKSFSVYRKGNDYYFSNPNSVKNWAYNFIDIADSTNVDFEVVKNSSGTVTVSAKENNITKASVSGYYTGTFCNDDGICFQEP